MKSETNHGIVIIPRNNEKEIRMLELMFTLAVLALLFWLGFKFCTALLSILIWVCFKLPFALFIFALGLACCITILLVPLGLKCFSFGLDVLT